ncbi:sodium:solute symporter family transporter [Shigella flexneri]
MLWDGRYPDLTYQTGYPYADGKVLPPIAAGSSLRLPWPRSCRRSMPNCCKVSATIIKDLYLNLRPEQLKNETRLKRMSAVITRCCWARFCAGRLETTRDDDLAESAGVWRAEAVFLWPLVLGLYWSGQTRQAH